MAGWAAAAAAPANIGFSLFKLAASKANAAANGSMMVVRFWAKFENKSIPTLAYFSAFLQCICASVWLVALVALLALAALSGGDVEVVASLVFVTTTGSVTLANDWTHCDRMSWKVPGPHWRGPAE